MNKRSAEIYLVGNAHIDPVWMWEWQDGFAEIKATFRSMLDRMIEFPEATFAASSACFYEWIEENAADMFSEIKRRVDEGRWSIVGGWWVEPDCNIPCGESYVRQALFSQSYFMKKFGRRATVAYNIDSFGHNASLPQVLTKSGMTSYVIMRPQPNDKIVDNNLFLWEGIDGTRILTFRIPTSYSCWWGEPNGVDFEKQKILEHVQIARQSGLPMLNLYGVGNHGGGPTIRNLEMIREAQDEMPPGTLAMSTPEKYFTRIEEDCKKSLEVHKGELNFPTGVYSTGAAIKSLNRKSESRLLNAEKICTLAHALQRHQYPGQDLLNAWKSVLFNQFHDIMGGCSIRRVHEDIFEWYGEALTIAAKALNAAAQRITWNIDTTQGHDPRLSKETDWFSWEDADIGTPLVLVNRLHFEVTTPVVVNREFASVKDENNTAFPVQLVRGGQTNWNQYDGKYNKWNTLFTPTVPAFGYKVFWFSKKKAHADEGKIIAHTDGVALENGAVRVMLDIETCSIKSIIDKKTGFELLKANAARAVVIDEKGCDTWAFNVKEFRNEIGGFENTSVEAEVLENGPLRASVRLTGFHGDSKLEQVFSLSSGAAVEVRARIDWHERHKMVKIAFPTAFSNTKTTYEIPFGCLQRIQDGREVVGLQWVDVEGKLHDREHGLLLINDSKYSYDCLDGELRMTVLRSPAYANLLCTPEPPYECTDQGLHEFSYSITSHAGNHEAVGAARKAMTFNNPLIQVVETYHKGGLPTTYCGIHLSTDDIIVSAIKEAENGRGSILRCYECYGNETDCAVDLAFCNHQIRAHFMPFEIKTFFIPFDGSPPVETNLIEAESVE
jgi:alpha-mannosidase